MIASINAEDQGLWTAIAEPNRRLLLDILLNHNEATASSLAAEVPFTRQAVTKHLVILNSAGLVQSQRHGREVRYTIRAQGLDEAARAMSQVARRWDERLNAIKHIAETAHRSDISKLNP